MTNINLGNYYYGAQLEAYIIEYMAVFSGLKVSVGKNDFNSPSNLVKVPITYGSRDRVVSAILSENTQNKPIRVPTLAANLISIERDPSALVGSEQTIKNARLPMGATLPDGVIIVEKLRPVPYRIRMETAIYASNTQQHFQMLEQILMLFNPNLQIQISDSFDDWAKITTITMEDLVSFGEEYPSGTARRILTSTINFNFIAQFSPPYNFRTDYIKSINLKLNIVELSKNVHLFVEEDAREVDYSGYETVVSVYDRTPTIVTSTTPIPTITPTITSTPAVTPTLSVTPSA